MTKTEIIQSVSSADVPQSAQLVEHSIPDLSATFSRFEAGGDKGAGKLMMAGILAQQLEMNTAELPDVPGAPLFEKIHQSILALHLIMLEDDDGSVEDFEKEVVSTHRKMITRLREISSNLGISFREPLDGLMPR